MIVSFKDRMTEAAFDGRGVKGCPTALLKLTRRKLEAINAAAVLSDLASPPGNHLEALSGDRAGQHSIRVNDQYRICFIWTEAGPIEVEFVDYHK